MRRHVRRQRCCRLFSVFMMLVVACLLAVILPSMYTAYAQSCGGPTGDPCLGSGGGFSPGSGGYSPNCSPIVIDLTGDGFKLTDAQQGVRFDIGGNGHPLQIAWTSRGAANAFLCLDRNGNGTIDSGKELFGNFTDQPPSSEPNGFLALAEFDKPENGGNADGVIDRRDRIFSSLRLWIDANHDGISQPNELFTLPERGIFSISLQYKESRKMDSFGNQFRYRSAINVQQGNASAVGRIAYDVFLVTQ